MGRGSLRCIGRLEVELKLSELTEAREGPVSQAVLEGCGWCAKSPHPYLMSDREAGNECPIFK